MDEKKFDEVINEITVELLALTREEFMAELVNLDGDVGLLLGDGGFILSSRFTGPKQ